MELILHLGYGKCGSTYIQNYLKKYKAEYSRQGIINFDAEDEGPGNVWTNFFTLSIDQGDTEPSEMVRRLGQLELDNPQAKKIIISDENFIHLTRGCPGRKAHELIKEYYDDIKIIYYVRRQDDFLSSAYQEWGHRDGSTIYEYVARSEMMCVDQSAFYHLVQNIIALYGKNRIYIRPVDVNCLRNGSLIDDFCSAAGISLFNDLSDIEANQGLNLALCDALSRVSAVFDGVHDGSVRKLLETTIRSKELLYSKENRLFNSMFANQIMDSFRAQNAWLHANFFPMFDFDVIYGNRDSERDSDELKNRIVNLETVVSLQLDVIIGLLSRK